MALTGAAKTAYQREYMRRRRARLASTKQEKPDLTTKAGQRAAIERSPVAKSVTADVVQSAREIFAVMTLWARDLLHEPAHQDATQCLRALVQRHSHKRLEGGDLTARLFLGFDPPPCHLWSSSVPRLPAHPASGTTTISTCSLGAVVRRVMKAAAVPIGMSWMWTLAFGYHEDRTPTHGYGPTREAAMAAFATSWRRE